MSLINERYQLQKLISSTQWTGVYIAKDMQSNEIVIVKLEDVNNPRKTYQAEYDFYAANENMNGIPSILWRGAIPDNNMALVMQHLKPSLYACFLGCKKRFSLRTTLFAALQMIKLLEDIHKTGYVYANVKPEHFLLGAKESERHKLYIIDFSEVIPYLQANSKQHVAFRECREYSTLNDYSSTGMHIGVMQTRRDDMQSLGYMLLHFVLGALPWDQCENADEMKYMKVSTLIKDLTAELPIEFASYMYHVCGLKFDESPNYEYLHELFYSLFKRIMEGDEFHWDWHNTVI